MSWSQAKAKAHNEWKRRNRGDKAGEAADVSLRSRSPARRATAEEPSAPPRRRDGEDDAPAEAGKRASLTSLCPIRKGKEASPQSCKVETASDEKLKANPQNKHSFLGLQFHQ